MTCSFGKNKKISEWVESVRPATAESERDNPNSGEGLKTKRVRHLLYHIVEGGRGEVNLLDIRKKCPVLKTNFSAFFKVVLECRLEQAIISANPGETFLGEQISYRITDEQKELLLPK